eukprot:gnl/TRDRNA2_/TRDRNA2_45734_c0_seq1.p1 gnl/TRDRNA2_/TRDRNA2_45734_c0~~gnl/TRDRNA2_/TRDRNA2_45734_c0_seq1.p1  ORF type:complete len:362 (-),score=39.36 gnl/TRDRNA2_/TRDRNA2_45734_c0_seq1:27-1112(-)
MRGITAVIQLGFIARQASTLLHDEADLLADGDVVEEVTSATVHNKLRDRAGLMQARRRLHLDSVMRGKAHSDITSRRLSRVAMRTNPRVALPCRSEPCRAMFASRSYARHDASIVSHAESHGVPDATRPKELKKNLFAAVAARNVGPEQRKQRILAAAQTLENLGILTDPVDGRWSLVYSTMSREPAISSSSDDSPVREGISLTELPGKLTDVIYKSLFQFLPALAGGQEEQGSGRGLLTPQVRNEQLVDLANGVVDNIVDVVLTPGESSQNGLRIGVRGTVRPISDSLEIIFTEWSLGQLKAAQPFLRLPLPRPVGRLYTTYCDETLRLSRGSRGGLFVLRRIKTAGAATTTDGDDKEVE